MRTPERKTIGTATFVVTPLGATAGLRLLTKLARIAGPGFSRVLDVKTEGPTISGIPVAGILAAAEGILVRMEDADLADVCAVLAESTMAVIDGAKAVKLAGSVFDNHFAADYAALYAWAAFALEVNYGPLLVALRDKGASLEAAPSAPTP